MGCKGRIFFNKRNIVAIGNSSQLTFNKQIDKQTWRAKKWPNSVAVGLFVFLNELTYDFQLLIHNVNTNTEK